MIYLLNTNICIYIMKNKPAQIRARLESIPFSAVGISSIVLAELWHGVFKSQHVQKNSNALKDFLKYLTVYDWPQDAARHYGRIRASLEKTGEIIGANDLLIAAHALETQATLVSNNIKEFERIDGLKLENWA